MSRTIGGSNGAIALNAATDNPTSVTGIISPHALPLRCTALDID